MTSRHRPRVTMAFLAAALLLSFVAPIADARMPRATRYHPGRPITLDTNLLSRSGVSAWAIDEYLKATTPLPALGAAFIGAEKKYGVNARFLLAAALHESGWGTSYISRVKHNLFGYNAYDRDPFRYANSYATYAASIDATAKFMKDSYLTPGGRWWGGQPTLRSMQQFWSSSGHWGVGVSRIATSIHLGSLARRSIAFAAPAVSGPLHGGSKAEVRLTWTGGAVPKGIEFVARWEPIEIDSDIVAGTSSYAVTDLAARRVRTQKQSITLAVATPPEPGSYLLDVEMRDSGRRPLPGADRVDIPRVEVRVWGDRAVSYDLEPSVDGLGVVVRMTNTGLETIPATLGEITTTRHDPDAKTLRSLVTVTASAGDRVDPTPVLLIAAPLDADLTPGASVTFDVPAIDAATGRTTNWLSVNLIVLGDEGWLTAHPPVGAWFSDARLGTPGSAGTAVLAATAALASPAIVAPAPTRSPAPTPAPTPTPTPTPPAASGPVPTPTRTPSPTPAPARVTRTYPEHSSAISYRGSWGDAANSRYGGGKVAWSKTPGATATFTFTGSSVTWIGPAGPMRGLALVILDGRAVARVDLWRSRFTPRVALFRRSFPTSGRHTLTIKVLSMPERPCVAIDEFVVRS